MWPSNRSLWISLLRINAGSNVWNARKKWANPYERVSISQIHFEFCSFLTFTFNHWSADKAASTFQISYSFHSHWYSEMQSIIDEDGNLNGDRIHMLLLMVYFSGDGTADGISGLVCMPFSAHYDISRVIQISIVRSIVWCLRAVSGIFSALKELEFKWFNKFVSKVDWKLFAHFYTHYLLSFNAICCAVLFVRNPLLAEPLNDDGNCSSFQAAQFKCVESVNGYLINWQFYGSKAN